MFSVVATKLDPTDKVSITKLWNEVKSLLLLRNLNNEPDIGLITNDDKTSKHGPQTSAGDKPKLATFENSVLYDYLFHYRFNFTNYTFKFHVHLLVSNFLEMLKNCPDSQAQIQETKESKFCNFVLLKLLKHFSVSFVPLIL